VFGVVVLSGCLLRRIIRLRWSSFNECSVVLPTIYKAAAGPQFSFRDLPTRLPLLRAWSLRHVAQEESVCQSRLSNSLTVIGRLASLAGLSIALALPRGCLQSSCAANRPRSASSLRSSAWSFPHRLFESRHSKNQDRPIVVVESLEGHSF
jgi:hypothetical protein